MHYPLYLAENLTIKWPAGCLLLSYPPAIPLSNQNLELNVATHLFIYQPPYCSSFVHHHEDLYALHGYRHSSTPASMSIRARLLEQLDYPQ